MSCFFPLRAYRKAGALDRTTGKWPITFDYHEGWAETAMDIPCGKCEGCRMDYARSWALRCVHEASQHERSCVLTLTFEKVPSDLSKAWFQKWLKRARARLGSFRYFGCFEHGEKNGRPHFHIIFFGYDFPDKELKTRHLGRSLYDSKLLREVWPYGHVSIGDVNFSSAAYIARYCFKKQKGVSEDEYLLMSRKPGIGFDFAKKYSRDFASLGFIVLQGQKYPIPKSYEKFFNDEQLRYIKARRLVKELSPRMLSMKRQVLLSRLKTLQRSFEQ